MDKAIRVCNTVFIAHEALSPERVVRERGITARRNGSGDNVVILECSELYCRVQEYWWEVVRAIYPNVPVDFYFRHTPEVEVVAGNQVLVGVDLEASGRRTMKWTQLAALLIGGRAEVKLGRGILSRYCWTKVRVWLPIGTDVSLLKEAWLADTRRGKRPPLVLKMMALR